MKQMEVGTDQGGDAKLKGAAPPPPPPPLPLPNFWAKTKLAASTVSVTNQEIARFWRQKRIDEEDHLLSAIKAAARIRARELTEEDYKLFEEALKEDQESKEDGAAAFATTANSSNTDEISKELRVGIKDWWTKSKYAYLNQPAIESMDLPKHRTSAYIPNFCNYKPASLPTTSFGVF
ncbi:hypothetical protein RHSIM_Rhsim10G0205800 [Rhododendron simsii]|uniref:Uncharacterized protein n=1 Tax=Rhododendron simsii TaxID=118357 RepID=A0A834GAC4_RHOSS|nr:hypothetical protein RHSIM_Rhsim10G0205800 [Rhododendron simsii]